MKNKRRVLIILVLVFVLFGIIVVWKNVGNIVSKPRPTSVIEDHSFDFNFIKEVNKDNLENSLISPYSVKVALNMLKDGTNNDSLKQIEQVLGDSKINDIRNDSVHIANGLFIKDKYRKEVDKKYINLLKNEYSADVVIDAFENPDKINNWVNKKTKKMIPVLLDNIDSDFVLALVNALAVDVKWEKAFDCDNTSEEVFYKEDGSEVKVAMMHDSKSNGKYFETDMAKGIILPYKGKNKEKLELIAILPNDNLNDYIAELDDEELNKIDKYNKTSERVSLSLPKFKYEYDLKTFMDVLIKMGIIDVFESGKADLSNMFKGNNDYYVSQAIHKTYIDLDEKGTKAAAATGFVVSKNAAEVEDRISISFNKPFAYIIRDKNSNEILFFGTMYEPNKWEGSNCND